jgi:hypothetical protein
MLLSIEIQLHHILHDARGHGIHIMGLEVLFQYLGVVDRSRCRHLDKLSIADAENEDPVSSLLIENGKYNTATYPAGNCFHVDSNALGLSCGLGFKITLEPLGLAAAGVCDGLVSEADAEKSTKLP